MKNISWKTILALIGAMGICVCAGFATVMFKGAIDYPCFTYYDAVNQCVTKGGYMIDEDREERIQVFLTTGYVGISGGGCHIQESNQDSMEVDTSVLMLELERLGERLLINGKELPAGEELSFTKFWNLNPWTVYTINLTNYGPVPICQSDAPPRIVVIGEYGNRISIPKGLTLLAVALAIVFKLLHRSKPKPEPGS